MNVSVTRLRIAVLARWEGNQYDLAQRCAISNSVLTKYLRGHRVPQPDHRAILAHVLGVEPPELDGWIAGDKLWQKVAS